MVTITSLVPKKARKNPGIAPAIAPDNTPATIATSNTTKRGASGIDNAIQILVTQPHKACPDNPILKKPAVLAIEKPSAVKISGAADTKISPILRGLTSPVNGFKKAVLNICP